MPVANPSFATYSWLTPTSVLAAVWVLVALVLLGRCWLQVRQLSKLLCRTCDGDERLRRIMRVAAQRMRVRGVGVRVVDAQLPPIIWAGWSEAFVVFPRQLVDELSDGWRIGGLDRSTLVPGRAGGSAHRNPSGGSDPRAARRATKLVLGTAVLPAANPRNRAAGQAQAGMSLVGFPSSSGATKILPR